MQGGTLIHQFVTISTQLYIELVHPDTSITYAGMVSHYVYTYGQTASLNYHEYHFLDLSMIKDTYKHAMDDDTVIANYASTYTSIVSLS